MKFKIQIYMFPIISKINLWVFTKFVFTISKISITKFKIHMEKQTSKSNMNSVTKKTKKKLKWHCSNSNCIIHFSVCILNLVLKIIAIANKHLVNTHKFISNCFFEFLDLNFEVCMMVSFKSLILHSSPQVDGLLSNGLANIKKIVQLPYISSYGVKSLETEICNKKR